MKAIGWTRYGPPHLLRLTEVDKPAPADNEVLIRVHAATVTAGDCELRSFRIAPAFVWLPLRLFFGITKPRRSVLGQELAGEIEAVGKDVTRFRRGDRVFAATLMKCGAYAEYVCLPETHPMAPVPGNMSYEEAATIPTGGINALHFLRKADARSGETVLVNGAGGSIGTYAVQIAKSLGAEVTAVDSAAKLDMLRALGADHVLDYREEDFTRGGKTWDVIIDVVGKSSFRGCVRSLKPNGRYVLGVPGLTGMIRGLRVSRTTDKKVLFEPAGYRREDFTFLKELVEGGQLKAVIDRRYPLQETADAHRYVDSGLKAGNVIIALEHGHET